MVLAGMNHLLENAKTGAANEYNDIEETMSTTALKIITNWLSLDVLTRRHETTKTPFRKVPSSCFTKELFCVTSVSSQRSDRDYTARHGISAPPTHRRGYRSRISLALEVIAQ